MNIKQTIENLQEQRNGIISSIDIAKKRLKEVEAKIKKANKLLAQANDLIDGDIKDQD